MGDQDYMKIFYIQFYYINSLENNSTVSGECFMWKKFIKWAKILLFILKYVVCGLH